MYEALREEKQRTAEEKAARDAHRAVEAAMLAVETADWHAARGAIDEVCVCVCVCLCVCVCVCSGACISDARSLRPHTQVA